MKDTKWDVVVIGGGPAGMMAAGRAAEKGARVVLLEKNAVLGKKLLITGGGRCNILNGERDVKILLKKYKENSKFLHSPFSKFGVKESLDFFESRGLKTKEEAQKRVFPVSDKAESVLNVLQDYIKKGSVTVINNAEVTGFTFRYKKIASVKLKNGGEIVGESYILATGGKSRPETGSTGEGFNWLKSLGHTIIQPDSALVPISSKDAFIKRLQGVSLKDVLVKVLQNDVVQVSEKGRIIFTHFGLSGPTILHLSKDVRELLKYGKVYLSLDLFDKKQVHEIDKELRDVLREDSKKKVKNVLGEFISARLSLAVLSLANVDEDKFSHSITKEERLKIASSLKDFRISVFGVMGLKKAVVTSGGVSLKEVDFTTMASKIVPNLFLVGDVLDIDRPSGGYSLQLCWTTGYIAGDSAR